MQCAAGGRSTTTRSQAAAWGRSPICVEALILFVICVLDMLSSAWLFHHGLAVEANPLLRPAAEAGVLPFILAKSLSFVPPLIALELLRRRYHDFIVRLLRGAIVAYLAIYGLFTGGQLF